jgi:hypothetical protein
MNMKCICKDKEHQASPLVEQLIAELGENINVTCNNKTYSVPRIFIAVHGLKAVDLPKLFKPVRNAESVS